jgi:hypothetical protein
MHGHIHVDGHSVGSHHIERASFGRVRAYVEDKGHPK